MSNTFKTGFDKLGAINYINSFLIEKGVRDAYLIQNFESTEIEVNKMINNIQVIFPESNVNLDSIHKIKDIAKKMGFTLFVAPSPLYADSLGKDGEGQDSYLKMLTYNAEMIAKCLKSKEAYESI